MRYFGSQRMEVRGRNAANRAAMKEAQITQAKKRKLQEILRLICEF
jgi:hypothetical protein